MGSIEALFPSIIGSDDPVELILLGTGTSSTLPHVDCLTAPPGSKPCRACLATLDPSPDAQKNRRVRLFCPFATRTGRCTLTSQLRIGRDTG